MGTIWPRRKANEIVAKKLMETEKYEIVNEYVIFFYPPFNNPILQRVEQFLKEDDPNADDWIVIDIDNDTMGLPIVGDFHKQLYDYYHVICHAKFTGEYAETARYGAQQLAHLRPQGKLRFYAYYSTAIELSMEPFIDEVLTLEELLQKGEVWTADAFIADQVLQGLAPEKAYLATLKQVRSVNQVPIYTHEWTNVFDAGLFSFRKTTNLRTNEFMLVLKE